MPSEINNSKEAIKNRMLKHALNYWNIKNAEDIDPAIKLILEALSSELYNLSNEIKDAQVRILEKIAGLLTPDLLASAKPAHAIAHASPIEAKETLSTTTAFLTQRKISSKQNDVTDTSINVFFTPADALTLFNVDIPVIATPESLYACSSSEKQLIAKAKRGLIKDNNVLWVGLKVNTNTADINNMSFCFDWKNLELSLALKNNQLLPFTKWYLNDVELKTKAGRQYMDTEKRADNLFSDFDLLTRLENDVKQYYDQKFISLTDDRLNNTEQNKQKYPSVFTSLFVVNDLQKLTEDLLWLKVVFPPSVHAEFLEDLYVYPNAFPVINRQLNDVKYRLKGGSNIIPLKTEMFQQFLAVKSLSDQINVYEPVPYGKTGDEETGTYTIRYGGVERFDSRNARELINYLLELLRSEGSAFAAYGYDFIATTMKDMYQKISLMEQKTKGYINNAAEVPSYIIVKPFDGKDMMYAEYWTTLGDLANNLRAGTRLQLEKGVKVKPDIFLLTTSVGGKNKLQPEEKLSALKYGIMTRNRIVTKEDIRSFCFTELGSLISNVTVERGFELSPLPHEAFKRTLDVKLTPGGTTAINQNDWVVICEQLKSKLQSRSGVSNNYRILVSKD